MRRITSQSGATVVEILVYLFMFILLSGASLTLLFSLDGLFTQYRAKQLLLTSGTALMERVLTEVRGADTLLLPGSVVGSSTAAVLTLEHEGVSRQIAWNTTTNQVEWREGGVYGGLLHSEAVTINNMRFDHYEVNERELVRVVVELGVTIDGYTEALNLEGGAIIRGSYVQS